VKVLTLRISSLNPSLLLYTLGNNAESAKVGRVRPTSGRWHGMCSYGDFCKLTFQEKQLKGKIKFLIRNCCKKVTKFPNFGRRKGENFLMRSF